MAYAVVGAWMIQAAVGATLLIGWLRHGRRRYSGAVFAHVALMLLFLGPWIIFVATGAAAWAWAAVGVLFVGIPFGDALMTRRARRARGEASRGMRDYLLAIGAVFSGRMPPRVTFHALFSAVVFFGAVAVAVAATVGG